MRALIDAAGSVAVDKKKLVELVQSQNSKTDDEEIAAPAAAAYMLHSSGLVDVLEDMKEKAEGSLSDLRKEGGKRFNVQL